MDKRVFFVILLAAIVAFFVAFVVLKPTETGKEAPITQEEVIQEKASEEQPDADVLSDKAEEKPVVKTIPKTIKKVQPTPVIKPLKVEESSQLKSEDQTIKLEDVGIRQEDSGVVTITREFKSQSPAKYSFRGYGQQTAPTK